MLANFHVYNNPYHERCAGGGNFEYYKVLFITCWLVLFNLAVRALNIILHGDRCYLRKVFMLSTGSTFNHKQRRSRNVANK